MSEDIEFHDEAWPVLLTVFPDRKLEDREWVWYLDHLAEVRQRGFMLQISDSHGTAHLPNAKQRELIANHPATRPGDDATPVPSFVVAHSALFRGIVRALTWLNGNEYNIVFCATRTEAIERVTAYARDHGVELSVDPRVLLERRAKVG